MTSQDVYQRLSNIFPEFELYWNDPENCFREDDGTFTLCGVFAEFSHFFREQFEQLSHSSLTTLGQFLTECMTEPNTELDNAVATCFLENISYERFSSTFGQYLRGNALKFYLQFE